MNAPITIQINDGATVEVKEAIQRADPHRIATRVAVPVAKLWRNHLAQLPKNKNGYPSTGFWEDAARKVRGIAQGPDVLIYSDKLGLRQRWYGGKIEAVNVSNLTIPICAEAYGTKVSDWGFENLQLVIINGVKFFALKQGGSAGKAEFQKAFKRKKDGGYWSQRSSGTTNRANNIRGSLKGTKEAYTVIRDKTKTISQHIQHAEKHTDLKFLFVLKKEVMQEGNPDVVPLEEMLKLAKTVAWQAVVNTKTKSE